MSRWMKRHISKCIDIPTGGCLYEDALWCRSHRLAQHSRRLVPMNRNRARVLEIDAGYMYANSAADRRRGALPDAIHSRRDATQQIETREHNDVHMPQNGSQYPTSMPHESHRSRNEGGAAPPRRRSPGESRHQGFVMFDDEEGTHQGDLEAFGGGLLSTADPVIAEFPDLPTRTQTSQPRTSRPALSRAQLAFPSLESAAVSGAMSAVNNNSLTRPSPASTSRHKPLVRQEVQCPCGNKRSSVVVEEGAELKPLECDSRCHEKRRAALLSNAFAVDPVTYTSVFTNRHDVEWSLDLVTVCIQQAFYLHQTLFSPMACRFVYICKLMRFKVDCNTTRSMAGRATVY